MVNEGPPEGIVAFEVFPHRTIDFPRALFTFPAFALPFTRVDSCTTCREGGGTCCQGGGAQTIEDNVDGL